MYDGFSNQIQAFSILDRWEAGEKIRNKTEYQNGQRPIGH